jgi:regulator of sirC expression with transglutaminase-like and TPR domain
MARDTVMTAGPTPQDTLRGAASLVDQPLDLAEVALAFAAMDRPSVPLEGYRAALAAMVDAVAKRLMDLPEGSSAGDRTACLGQVLSGDLAFKGDAATYDDLQNANLMRVIDRHKGLPVALGILYIHAARGQGWAAEGLSFPNHFLIRVRIGADPVILDPFNQGRSMDAPALRGLIRDMFQGKGTLTPAATESVPDRHVLMRLQNNIKLRLHQSKHFTEALEILERMRMLAPDLPHLQREAGMVNARIGNFRAAIMLLRSYLDDGAGDPADRRQTAQLLQEMEKRLN